MHFSRRMLVNHPGWVASFALMLLAAFGLWQFRSRRIRATLEHLPAVERAALEPSTIAIIQEGESRVKRAPFSGKAWGQYGMILLAQDFFTESVVCLEQAERLDPSEFRWPYLRALCLEQLDPETAMECLRRAGRFNVAVPKVRLAEMLLSRGNLDEAEKLLKDAQLLAPRDPRLIMNFGHLALLRDDTSQAIQSLKYASELDPQRRRTRVLLCQALRRTGDEVALNEQMRILSSIPEAEQGSEWPDPYLAEIARYKRGTMWTLQVATRQIFAGKCDDAIALLEKSGGRNADDPRIVVLLGKAYLRLDQLEQAEEVLRIAVQKDPNLAPAHFELGNMAMMGGRWNDAAEHYREAVRLQPDLSAAHYNLGLYHQHRGEREESVAAFELACRYMPTNFPAHREVAEVLLELGREQQAIEHLRMAEKLDPNDSKLQTLLERARSIAGTTP